MQVPPLKLQLTSNSQRSSSLMYWLVRARSVCDGYSPNDGQRQCHDPAVWPLLALPPGTWVAVLRHADHDRAGRPCSRDQVQCRCRPLHASPTCTRRPCVRGTDRSFSSPPEGRGPEREGEAESHPQYAHCLAALHFVKQNCNSSGSTVDTFVEDISNCSGETMSSRILAAKTDSLSAAHRAIREQ